MRWRTCCASATCRTAADEHARVKSAIALVAAGLVLASGSDRPTRVSRAPRSFRPKSSRRRRARVIGADRRWRRHRARHHRTSGRDAVPAEHAVLLPDRRHRAAGERRDRRPSQDHHGVPAAEDAGAGQQPVRAGHGAGRGVGHGARRGCRRRPRRVHRGDHGPRAATSARSTRRLPPRCSAARARATRRACGPTTPEGSLGRARLARGHVHRQAEDSRAGVDGSRTSTRSSTPCAP